MTAIRSRLPKGWEKVGCGLYRTLDHKRKVSRSAFGDWYLDAPGLMGIWVFPTMRAAMKGHGGKRLNLMDWEHSAPNFPGGSMSETPRPEAGELSVSFQVHDPSPREVLRITPNGRFFVHEREVETDAEVRELFAQWVKALGKNATFGPATPAPCRAGCPVGEAALWLLNCVRGVGKAGGSPERGEYEDAAMAVEEALRAPGAPAGPEPAFPHCEYCGSSAWFCTVCHARTWKPAPEPSEAAIDAAMKYNEGLRSIWSLLSRGEMRSLLTAAYAAQPARQEPSEEAVQVIAEAISCGGGRVPAEDYHETAVICLRAAYAADFGSPPERGTAASKETP